MSVSSSPRLAPPSCPCSSVSALAAWSLSRACKIPIHASRSILSSCKPLGALDAEADAGTEVDAEAEVDADASEGTPTPKVAGTKPTGGALIAEGAMREWRICASDDRIASDIAYPPIKPFHHK